jgi:hypothetical protein
MSALAMRSAGRALRCRSCRACVRNLLTHIDMTDSSVKYRKARTHLASGHAVGRISSGNHWEIGRGRFSERRRRRFPRHHRPWGIHSHRRNHGGVRRARTQRNSNRVRRARTQRNSNRVRRARTQRNSNRVRRAAPVAGDFKAGTRRLPDPSRPWDRPVSLRSKIPRGMSSLQGWGSAWGPACRRSP